METPTRVPQETRAGADPAGTSLPPSPTDVINSSLFPPRTRRLTKRTNDTGTLGGNAHTGNSGAVDGGDIVNAADNFGTPTLLNIHSNNGGAGGGSLSGCATGGVGDAARGAGGNAGSGTAGSAHGGSVWNSGAVANFYSSKWVVALRQGWH